MSYDAGEVKVRITSDTLGVQKGFEQTVKSLKALEAQINSSQKAITDAINTSSRAQITALNNMSSVSRATHKKIQSDVVKTNRSVKTLQVAFNQMYRTMFNIKTIALVMFGGVVAKIGDVNASAEKMTASLNVMTGGFGEEMFNALSSFAARTNVTTEEAVKQYTQLRAVGLQPTIDDMETMLDITNAFGGGSAIFQRLSKAFGDIAAKGRLMGEEVRQLTNIGVPIRQILVDAGLLAENMVTEIARANISSTKAIQAILDYAKKNFNGITEEIMGTWAGTIEKMEDTWWRWARVVGQAGFIDSMKEAMDEIGTGNEAWLMSLQSIGNMLSVIVDTFSSMPAIVWVIWAALKGVEGLLLIIAGAVVTVYRIFTLLYDSVVAISAGITGLVTSIVVLITEGPKAALRVLKDTGGVLKEIWDDMGASVESTLKTYDKIGDGYFDHVTEDTKKAVAVSKELEEVLNQLSVGMGATPVKGFEALFSQVNAAYQETLPKSQKLRKELDSFKDTYNFFFAKGGNKETIITSLKKEMEQATDPTVKKALQEQLQIFNEQVAVMEKLAPKAFAAREVEIQKQKNKELAGQTDLLKQIDTLYNKTVPLSTRTQGTEIAKANAMKSQLQVLQKAGYPLKEIQEYMTKLNEIIDFKNRGGIQGMIDGFDEVGIKMQETYTLWKDLATGITDSLTDAFTEFFDKGETDWGNFLSTIRTMMIETIVKQTIMGPIAEAMSLLTSSVGKTGSNWLSSVASWGTSLFTGAPATTAPVTQRANGGWINEPVIGYGQNSGKPYSFAERGSEYVSSTASSANMAKGGTGGITVNVYGGDGTAEVKQREGANGPEIDIMLDRQMAKLASGNSSFSKAIQAKYGLKTKRI